MASNIALIVGEKPSVALSVAKALSNNNFQSKKSFATPIHEFTGSFQDKRTVFRCTSVTGHVLNIDFHPKYRNWTDTEPRELFTAKTEKNPADKNGKICKHLQIAAKNVKYLILWLDCDREGENICFEVIDQCRFSMVNYSPKNIYRARFSSLAANDIKKAIKNLKKPNINESLSVEARQIIDLKVGVAFTRFQTLKFNEKYANLNSELISYGPCQIPTLYFCVERYDEILRFVPKPFWTVQLTIGGLSVPTKRISHGRFFNKSDCEKMLNKIKSEKEVVVTDTKSSLKKLPPPLPMNTLNLLKEASSKLFIGPGEAMSIAEKLYLKGLCSYPRTESTKYPNSFNYNNILNKMTTSSRFGKYAKSLIDNNYVVPKKGVDCGDHEPISPVENGSGLSGKEKSIYDLIASNFLASISPDCEYMSFKTDFKVADETFSLKASKTTKRSFIELNENYGNFEGQFPLLEKGETVPLKNVIILSEKTKPPSYLSESQLLTLMAKNGIGTDASMSTHIQNIINRNYVTTEKGRTLVPTTLGIVLVHGYQRIDEELVLPSIRSLIEKRVDQIALGKEKINEVVDSSIDLFTNKFDHFVDNIEKMDLLFRSHFDTLKETKGRMFSKCGNCHRFMKFIESRPVRLFCPNCDVNYKIPLPRSFFQKKNK